MQRDQEFTKGRWLHGARIMALHVARSKFLTHCALITLNNGLVDIGIWAEYRRTSTASKRADGLHPAVPANDHMGHAQLMSHTIYKRQ